MHVTPMKCGESLDIRIYRYIFIFIAVLRRTEEYFTSTKVTKVGGNWELPRGKLWGHPLYTGVGVSCRYYLLLMNRLS